MTQTIHIVVYSALPDPVAGFKGLTSTGREGKGWGMGGEKGREWEERRGERKDGRKKGGREEKGRGAYRDEAPLTKIQNTPLSVFISMAQLVSRPQAICRICLFGLCWPRICTAVGFCIQAGRQPVAASVRVSGCRCVVCARYNLRPPRLRISKA